MKKLVIAVSLFALSFGVSASDLVNGVVSVSFNNAQTLYQTKDRYPSDELEERCEELNDNLSGGWIKFGSANWDGSVFTCGVSVGSMAVNKLSEALLEQVDEGILILK